MYPTTVSAYQLHVMMTVLKGHRDGDTLQPLLVDELPAEMMQALLSLDLVEVITWCDQPAVLLSPKGTQQMDPTFIVPDAEWFNSPWERPKVIYAGADDLPAHIYPHCSHLQRKLRNDGGRVKCYRLSGSSRIAGLIRCHWCRAQWLEAQVEGRPI